MTDREKIVEIITKNGVYNGRSLSFDYYVVNDDDLADALIADGIGDVSEWKRRAEVAERAGKIIQRNMFRVFGTENPIVNARINGLWDSALQQAEREIEENALRQAAREIEEERK